MEPHLEAPRPPTPRSPRLEGFFLEPERAFYGRYRGWVNPFPSIREVIGFLRHEIAQLGAALEDWQLNEVRTNVVLLACALSDTADDFLGGKRVDLSRIKKTARVLAPLVALPERILNARQATLESRMDGLRRWRGRWEDAVHRLLLTDVRPERLDAAAFSACARSLLELLDEPLPPGLTDRFIKSPRAFRSQDLVLEDVGRLADRFCAQFPERGTPYLVIGLRTAGSYFGPILRAALIRRGYGDVGIVTLRPKGGVGRHESTVMQEFAKREATAILIDEPVYRGATLAITMPLLQEAGFAPRKTAVLFPVHPSARRWRDTLAPVALHGCHTITIEPEETAKYELMHQAETPALIATYFRARGITATWLPDDARAKALNARLAPTQDESFASRLKRVFAFDLRGPAGELDRRYVIAKSVGCGWKGYHAFFAAEATMRHVPPVLGMRHGILFSEWVDGGPPDLGRLDRARVAGELADYVAARVAGLRFEHDPSPALCREGLQLGSEILTTLLSEAYHSRYVARVKRPGIRSAIEQWTSPTASLVDARLRASEWVETESGLLKTDFEQHGMGRAELSVTDPAYDLADGLLAFGLSPKEEQLMLARYVALTKDDGIATRLPPYKLLVGEAAMATSLDRLDDLRLAERYPEYHRAYIAAWTFSMFQMARFCASFMPASEEPDPSRPLVFSDVDGIIDRHVFRFPTATQSGVHALTLLKAHRFPVYLNTARSREDVRAYCAAYGLAGAVAEAGSWLWDAATEREEVLVSAASLAEIARVREALERLPGVFTNPDYRYSIKAFTYTRRGTIPLPAALISKVLEESGAGTLTFHQTSTDTAVTSREVDKGTGLVAMLRLLGRETAETIAIGDTEPDLAMFRVATRAYAPAHTPVRSLARVVGCRVTSAPYQTGFLEAVREIVHPDGATCARCAAPRFDGEGHAGFLIRLLGDVERSNKTHLREAVLDLGTWKSFVK